MGLKSLLQPRVYLLAGGALSMAGALALNHDLPKPPDEGIVWVYHAALCAAAGDARDCAIIPDSQPRVFDSIEACSAHRDVDLARAGNPRLLGTCTRQHEA